MVFSLDELCKNTSKFNLSELLDCWTWLVKDLKTVLLISKLGDMFFEAKDGKVYWLSTAEGSLTQVAENTKQFSERLNNEDDLDYWFLPQLIKKLEDKGKYLLENQVYSFKMMPLLGGEYSVDNFEPTDVSVHFAINGQICEQVKDLPDGTNVKIKLTS